LMAEAMADARLVGVLLAPQDTGSEVTLVEPFEMTTWTAPVP